MPREFSNKNGRSQHRAATKAACSLFDIVDQRYQTLKGSLGIQGINFSLAFNG
jgi:hypothetical protein